MRTHSEIYGCDDINDYIKSVEASETYRLLGANAIVLSLLSDAQEEIANFYNADASKTLNRAKYLVALISSGDLVGSRARG